MSPFAAILYPDGRPVQPEEVHRLLDPIGYAGPGGRAVWTDGPFGVGCLYPGGLARGAVGEQPVQGADARLVLIADARLDARAELRRALGLTGADGDHQSDPALLLAAWQRWGLRCGERIYGDYAFVVYDRQARTLAGLTDAPGARRLCHARLASGAMLVASDDACLLAHDELIDGWAEVPLAIWLTGSPQRNRSIFARIRVAACGESLELRGDVVRISKWWDPTRVAAVRKGSLADYAAAYRGLLTAVVDERIGASPAVVCELSGGMDSSSVTAAARTIADRRGLRLATVSHVYPGFPSCDDAHVMAATRAGLGITDAVVVDAFGLLKRELPTGLGPRAESPGAFTNLFHDIAIEAARTRGAGAILIGFGGDELTRGTLADTVFARLGRGDWRALQEVGASASRRGEPLARVVIRDLGRPTARRLLGDALADPLSTVRLWQRYLPPWLDGGRPLAAAMLRAFRAAAAVGGSDSRTRQLLGELHISPCWYQLDAYRLNAATAGIAVHAPLLDRRMVEFAIGTPADLWYCDGWNKFLVREAFAGLLPAAPRQAVRKVMVDEPARAIWRLHQSWAAAVLRAASQVPIAGALAQPLACLAERIAGADGARVNASSSIFLALWLTRRAGQLGPESSQTILRANP